MTVFPIQRNKHLDLYRHSLPSSYSVWAESASVRTEAEVKELCWFSVGQNPGLEITENLINLYLSQSNVFFNEINYKIPSSAFSPCYFELMFVTNFHWCQASSVVIWCLCHLSFVTYGFPFEHGGKMRLRNRFCHVFCWIRAISVLSCFSTRTAVMSASAACLKTATVTLVFSRRGTAAYLHCFFPFFQFKAC